jgi:Tfp pilus assembly protein PilV
MNGLTPFYKSGKVMENQRGNSLLEVLIGIVIFVIGMLALASLQGNLTRSSSDANIRTVAANVGEEILEGLRAFEQLDSATGVFAYNDIVSVTGSTVPRGGINYGVDYAVQDYYFDSDRTSVTTTAPSGAVYSDFKLVTMIVSWSDHDRFQVSDTQQITAADIGTGSVTLREIVPSIPALASAKIAAKDDGELGNVPVDYTPGYNPDIVAINLGSNRFKESTTPKPDVIRRDELVETWFDVITYNQVNSDYAFLRREEFLVVDCECTLRDPSGSDPTGFKPTVWNGIEYAEGDFVRKPYGESASNAQSPYCDTCCRDHHDGASGTTPDDELYDPRKTWTAGSATSNHEHYGRTDGGTLTAVPVAAGEDYVEVCRMVRKDGFLRVAQDFRQEQFIGVPQSYFTSLANIAEYSSYVTTAIDEYIKDLLGGNSAPVLEGPGDQSPRYTLPADDANNRIALPVISPASNDVQLITRGIYIDHLSTEAETLLDCLAPSSLGGQNKTPEQCGAEGEVTSYREVFPFFDVQLTWLSWWRDDVSGDPVSVTSEALADDNTHSRGLAALTGAAVADVTVNADIHRGNAGIAAIDPIDPYYYTQGLDDYDMFIAANGGGSSPGVIGTIFSGSIGSAVGGVQASGTTFSGSSGVICSLNVTQFSCTIDPLAVSPTLTVSGYWKNAGTDLWVCESTNTYGESGFVQTDPKSTTIDLSSVSSDVTNIILTIQNSMCP